MKIEETIKLQLLLRGFNEEKQLNNRGLIGATVDETILAVVKNMESSSSIMSESDSLSNPLVKMQVDSIIESRDKLDKSQRTAVALLKDLWEHPELRKDHLYNMQVETYLATER